MRLYRDRLWTTLAGWTRPVVAALLSRVWAGHDQAGAERRLAALRPRDEAAITLAVLALLFLLALLAAQFGWVGMGLYFAAVILIVR